MAEDQSKKIYFPINHLADVVRARRQGLEMALEMGFPQAEATKIAVVISELGRNIERYAKNSSITVTAHYGLEKYVMIVAKTGARASRTWTASWQAAILLPKGWGWGYRGPNDW